MLVLADGDAAAFALQHGLHEANIWPLETPLRHAQMEALLRPGPDRQRRGRYRAAHDDRTGRRLRYHRAGAGRIWYRQGSGVARHPPALAAP
ncbi:hypothetical protein G6F40_017282 [Rhizopus arrhizus]|nr:hypothetical protein G6F40_017282 [Rhizopus arrhizus]